MGLAMTHRLSQELESMRREAVRPPGSLGASGTQVLQGQPQAGRVTHVSVVSLLCSQGSSAHRTSAHPQRLLYHQWARQER